MAEQPLCPECDRPMNFVVAKLTEDETPSADDVKSGWYCPDCGIFKPTEMTGEIDLSTLDINVKDAIRITSSAAFFIPDDWVLEDKTEEMKKILEEL